jgi:DNA-binding SARP family transcriptional activator
MVCLLGTFRVLKLGQPVATRQGGKAEVLLSTLGLHDPIGVPRDTLLNILWPNSEWTLAGQSLNSLVYSLHKLLGSVIGNAAPVLLDEGRYRLNHEAGVGVDVSVFDALVERADRHARAGQHDTAIDSYLQAVELYRGDFALDTDVASILERERLLVAYLTLLARLADHTYAAGDYRHCLQYALKLLAKDACREDAHRLVMRCYVRCGERSQALRQYRLCEEVLRTEFDAAPEPATIELYNLIRLDPASV